MDHAVAPLGVDGLLHDDGRFSFVLPWLQWFGGDIGILKVDA